MIYLLYLSNILLFPLIIYLLVRNYKLNKLFLIKEIDKDNIRLPIPKYELPKMEDVDKEHCLLKDIIESIKLENWTCDVTYDSGYGSRSYVLLLENPSKTLTARSRIYLRDSLPSLSTFVIMKKDGNLSYNCDNKEVNFLVLSGVWDYIIKYHDGEYSRKFEQYITLKESIESHLVTIRRDLALKKLLKQIDNK